MISCEVNLLCKVDIKHVTVEHTRRLQIINLINLFLLLIPIHFKLNVNRTLEIRESIRASHDPNHILDSPGSSFRHPVVDYSQFVA